MVSSGPADPPPPPGGLMGLAPPVKGKGGGGGATWAGAHGTQAQAPVEWGRW